MVQGDTAMTTVTASYIVIDKNGTPRVAGTRSSVANIVVDTMNGMTPADIHRGYPHLSMAQIHAALAYYYDHKDEIDADIARGEALYEAALREGKVASRAELEKRLKEKLGKTGHNA
jgi:uncharacterized protein (DUF433 family)